MLTWRSSNSCAQELHYGSMLASHSFPMKLALLLLGEFVFRGNALQAGFPVLMHSFVHSFVQESSACKKRRAKQAAKGKIAKAGGSFARTARPHCPQQWLRSRNGEFKGRRQFRHFGS